VTDNDQRTQNIAVILIVLAAICIAIGCNFEWRDLINFAMTFGGGGVGILTGHKLAQQGKLPPGSEQVMSSTTATTIPPA
jgi:hypothetical protein